MIGVWRAKTSPKSWYRIVSSYHCYQSDTLHWGCVRIACRKCYQKRKVCCRKCRFMKKSDSSLPLRAKVKLGQFDYQLWTFRWTWWAIKSFSRHITILKLTNIVVSVVESSLSRGLHIPETSLFEISILVTNTDMHSVKSPIEVEVSSHQDKRRQ